MSQVAKSFGVDIILDGVNFRIDAREKVALVGRNGAGKTTLLKILTRQYEPDRGSIQFARGAKVGYLKQEAPVGLGRTVLQEAQQAVEERLQARERLAELEAVMEAGEANADLLEEYALLHEHFMDAEGYTAESDLRMVLLRMGFTEDEFDKLTDALSGGEKTRLAIAKLLLEEPDLLILDEPTNHLDLQATEWLENWIRQYHGAVILVSHDRTFLENTAERVLEMRDGQVKAYPGPFEKYIKLRAEEEARQAEVARRQEQEIARMDEYVRRFMNSQRTAQARGRLKLLNRLIESKVEAPKNDRGMKGGFGDSKRSGDIVVETQKLTVGFPSPEGEVVLFKDLDWTVRNGDRWGIIGENGAGKSTLMKVVFDQIPALGGKARLGAGVVAGYFTQDAVDLDHEISPLDTMVYEMDLKPAEARNLLARFLITGEDVYRPIKTLSGGEKNKLSLAKLTHLNPNLLVLDEPTNHLDMASREALGEILKEFKGTLILISHDRWLLSQVADQTLDIRRAGPIVYQGGYQDYRAGKAVPTDRKAAAAAKPSAVAEAPAPALTPRELSKEIQRVERLVADTEGEITSLEARLKSVEESLSNLAANADVLELTTEHQRLQEAIEGQMGAWGEHSQRLEELIALRGG